MGKSDILDTIPFFSILNENERTIIMRHMERHTVPRFAMIYHGKHPATEFYILTKGSIKTGINCDGREIIRQILHPRMVFGERALIDGNALEPYFAMALSPQTEYYSIKVAPFRQLMDDNPQLAMGVLSLLSLHLRRTEQQMASLILKDARSRIIDFILEHAQLAGRTIGFEVLLKHSLTQQDIANSTGTSRQTVTAVLNDLRKSNKIYFKRNTILIRDMAGLAT